MPSLQNAPSNASSISVRSSSPTKQLPIHERLRVGAYPWLWNKDHTRYAGETMIPQHLFEIQDYDKREAAITEFEERMCQKPLTDEERRQKAEWNELVNGPEPMQPLDDDLADAMIAWSEGRGERPTCLDQGEI